MAGVLRRSPVSGLARRSIGFVDVLAQSVSAVAPSAAAITIPSIVAAVAGNGTLWAVVGALLLSLLVATTVNQFTRRMSATGSLYTFVSKGLGTGAGFVTGIAMFVGYAFVAMFSLTGCGLFLATLLGSFLPGIQDSTLLVSVSIVALAAVCFLVLARGIRLSTRVMLIVESASVAFILVLTIAMIARQGGGIHWSVLSLSGTTPGEFATGTVLALMAFVGFESASTLGAEARKPFATIPRAIVWTVVASGALYLLSTYSQLVGFSALGRSLTSSTAPVNSLADAYGLPWMGVLLDASIATSFFACAIASTTALVRVIFSMARERLVSPALGRTHPTLKTPIVAVAVAVPVLAIVPVVTIALGGGVWEAMGVLLVASAAGYITSYVFVCAAAFVFLRRIGELGFWVGLRAIVAALLLGVGLVVYLIDRSASASSAGVWIFLAIISLGTIVYRVMRMRRPWLGSTIGVYDETILQDLLGGLPADPVPPGDPIGRR
ncbi:APC family permease [Glaciihabitans sp. INWT7]|uniref:APC family permease n=1 Tax=Glaciihabitans sp. INWT7 TaxID=2596912 RepID=UPI00210651B0|nr:APC family permease [Glaciihabitans sp. INWT7]